MEPGDEIDDGAEPDDVVEVLDGASDDLLDDALAPPGIPWVSFEILQRMTWRDGDVVVSVPAKSGATWMANVVHQLRECGDDRFLDIDAEVPWLEFLPSPEVSVDQRVAAIDAMPRDRRRMFRTHAAPGDLPYLPFGESPDVRYVVVMRNPEEAVASLYPFLTGHSDQFLELWGLPRAHFSDDLASFFARLGGIVLVHLFRFVAEWWPLRSAGNAVFAHYSDLVADPEHGIRRIAAFLDLEVAPERWPVVLEHSSFAWMKANEDRFERRHLVDGVPVLLPGSMVRKGRIGEAREDGISPEIAEAIAVVAADLVEDHDARRWLYSGGPLPV